MTAVEAGTRSETAESRVPDGTWRPAAMGRLMALRGEHRRLGSKIPADVAVDVKENLRIAATCLEQPMTARAWWNGDLIERTWMALHRVEEDLLLAVPHDELSTAAADVARHAARDLAVDDVLSEQLARLREGEADDKTLRAAAHRTLTAAHAASDENHRSARRFRNLLLLGSAASLIASVTVVILQGALSPVELFTRPAGWSGPAWGFALTIVLFGMVGSLVSAIPAMAVVPADRSPFNLPLQQWLLKLTFGGVTALVGLLAVMSTAIEIGLSETIAGVLTLAVLFGAGQQAITRFADRKAAEILGE